MPEGDTIRCFARRLEPVLVGTALVSARVRAGDFGFRGERQRGRRAEPVPALVGRHVAQIDTVGKHLILVMNEGPGLRVHLGLGGTWHLYEPGQRWRMPGHKASVVLQTEHGEVVCFGPMHVEWLDPRRRPKHPILSRLGPDLAQPEPDLDAVLQRAQPHLDRQVGDVILDQRIAAGIGNVVRSEALFLQRTHPLTPARDADLRAIYATGADILLRNAHHFDRTTTTPEVRAKYGAGARLWVYSRHGAPCWTCVANVEVRRIGDPPRGAWWCPVCQDARP